MKKIFVLFAVITALTVNTFAYTPSFALSGENETQDPVFRVRIFAKMIQTEQISTEGESSEMLPDDSEQLTNEVSDAVAHTVGEDTQLPHTDTEMQESTEHTDESSGIFGGEGTLIFDRARLQILSAEVCADDSVTVEHGNAGGYYRFMFYSAEPLKEEIPLLEIEFKILTGQGNVSVIISDGLFSDGQFDTPAENVSFTAVYKADETAPAVTSRPSESSPAVSTSVFEDSAPNTEKITEPAQSEGTLTNGDVSTSSPGGDDDRTSRLPLIIIVSAVVLVAASAAVILIKKAKK